MNLADYGITATISTSPNGEQVLNLTTDQALRVRVNGSTLTTTDDGSAQDRTRPLFWNPDGTQTAVDATNLRGEV